MNEAQSFHLHSNLTEQQQRDAEKAIYGEPMSPTDLTFEERVRMRRHLDQLDQKDAASASKSFDLNKPPAAPYIFREFPYLMYDHKGKRTRTAQNHEERERMRSEGWTDAPFPSEGAEIPLSAAEHLEAEEINSKLEKKRRA